MGLRPKKKCCSSRPRCDRCPLRMLEEGTLPEGYTVRNRRLVKQKQPHDKHGRRFTKVA